MKSLIININIVFFICIAQCADAQQQFHWEMTSGPGAGPVSLEVAPNGDLCVLSNGHFFRRTGKQWNEIPLPGNTHYQEQMTFGKLGSPILLLDTGLLRLNSGGGYKIVCSSYVRCLASDYSGNLTILIGRDSILFSTNEGDTWTFLDSSPPLRIERSKKDSIVTAIAHDNQTNTFFAATDTTAYSSTDNGKSWSILPKAGKKIYRFVLGHNGRLWVTAFGQPSSLSLSTDLGVHWRYVMAMPGSPALVPAAVDRDNLTLFLYSLTAGFFIPDTLPAKLSISAPETNDPNILTDAKVTLDSEGNWYTNFTYYSDRLIYITTGPNDKWRNFNDCPGSEVGPLGGGSGVERDMVHLPFGLFVHAGKSYLSTDRGTHWIGCILHSDTETAWSIASSQIQGHNFIGMSSTGSPVVSLDSGQTWKFLDSIGRAVNGIAQHGDTIYVMGKDTLTRSTDAGVNWQTANSQWPYNYPVLALDSSGDLFSYYNSAFWESTDFGLSWPFRSPMAVDYTDAVGMAAGKSRVVASEPESGILLSEDNGATWVPLHFYNWSDFMLTSDDDLYVCTVEAPGSYDGGVWFIPHGDTASHNVTANLPNHYVTWLASGDSGEIYAGTLGSGVWCSFGDPKNLGVKSTKGLQLTPTAYPNPAHDAVYLSGLSDKPDFVEAVNVMGVSQVLNCNPGTAGLRYDIANLHRGDYFLRIRIRGENSMVRLTVEK